MFLPSGFVSLNCRACTTEMLCCTSEKSVGSSAICIACDKTFSSENADCCMREWTSCTSKFKMRLAVLEAGF